MHPLVRRQLRKAFGDHVPESPELRAFIAAVDDAYAASDDDRKQLEHSLELASQELFERNTALEGQLERLRRLDGVVAQRTRDMALILDNVAQGLVTVDLDGRLRSEQSRTMVRWFGAPTEATRLWSYLFGHDPDLEAWVDVGFTGLRCQDALFDVHLEQMPSRIERDGRKFRIEYQPIGAPPTTVLVVVSDITEEIARQHAERAQRELIAVFEQAYHDRAAFSAFLHETDETVRTAEAVWDDTLDELKRLLHTLKGNCALFGVFSMSETCHELETEIEETCARPSEAERVRLVETWHTFRDQVDHLLGGSARRTIQVDWDDYQAVVARLDDPQRSWAAEVRRWGQDPTRPHLERFGDQATILARRLGKAALDVEIEDHELRLDGPRFAPLWSALIHGVRNAVVHGIETAEQRRAAGKPGRARLRMSTAVRGDELVVEIEDDGGGIDWRAVASRARARGLPAETPRELTDALFESGLSTASEITQEAGRGVGMDALRVACSDLGGAIEVTSATGRGTVVRCRVPLSANQPPRRRTTRASALGH